MLQIFEKLSPFPTEQRELQDSLAAIDQEVLAQPEATEWPLQQWQSWLEQNGFSIKLIEHALQHSFELAGDAEAYTKICDSLHKGNQNSITLKQLGVLAAQQSNHFIPDLIEDLNQHFTESEDLASTAGGTGRAMTALKGQPQWAKGTEIGAGVIGTILLAGAFTYGINRWRQANTEAARQAEIQAIQDEHQNNPDTLENLRGRIEAISTNENIPEGELKTNARNLLGDTGNWRLNDLEEITRELEEHQRLLGKIIDLPTEIKSLPNATSRFINKNDLGGNMKDLITHGHRYDFGTLKETLDEWDLHPLKRICSYTREQQRHFFHFLQSHPAHQNSWLADDAHNWYLPRNGYGIDPYNQEQLGGIVANNKFLPTGNKLIGFNYRKAFQHAAQLDKKDLESLCKRFETYSKTWGGNSGFQEQNHPEYNHFNNDNIDKVDNHNNLMEEFEDFNGRKLVYFFKWCTQYIQQPGNHVGTWSADNRQFNLSNLDNGLEHLWRENRANELPNVDINNIKDMDYGKYMEILEENTAFKSEVKTMFWMLEDNTKVKDLLGGHGQLKQSTRTLFGDITGRGNFATSADRVTQGLQRFMNLPADVQDELITRFKDDPSSLDVNQNPFELYESLSPALKSQVNENYKSLMAGTGNNKDIEQQYSEYNQYIKSVQKALEEEGIEEQTGTGNGLFRNFIEAISQNLQSLLPRNNQNANTNEPDGNEIDGPPIEPTGFNHLEHRNFAKHFANRTWNLINPDNTERYRLGLSEIREYSHVNPNEPIERISGEVQGLEESSDNIRHSQHLSDFNADNRSEHNARKLMWSNDLDDNNSKPELISNSHHPDESDGSFIEEAGLERLPTDVHFDHPYSAEDVDRAAIRHEGAIQEQLTRGQNQTDSHQVDTNQINDHARGEIESLGTNIDQQVKQNAVQEIRPGIDRELNKIGTNAAEAIDDGIQAGEDQIFNAEDTAENVALE